MAFLFAAVKTVFLINMACLAEKEIFGTL